VAAGGPQQPRAERFYPGQPPGLLGGFLDSEISEPFGL